MHGPALARNPELADLLLERATGTTLEPLEVPGVAQLREERLRMSARPDCRCGVFTAACTRCYADT